MVSPLSRRAWLAFAAPDVLLASIRPVCGPEVAAALRGIAVLARASGLAGGESLRCGNGLAASLALRYLGLAVRGATCGALTGTS